jgi:hypothetical protein
LCCFRLLEPDAQVVRRRIVLGLLRAIAIDLSGRPISLSRSHPRADSAIDVPHNHILHEHMGTRRGECSPAKLAIERCKRSGTPFKTCPTAYRTVFTGNFMENEELEDGREITRSMACRMPTNGFRQGMTAGPEMVGRGHVASL